MMAPSRGGPVHPRYEGISNGGLNQNASQSQLMASPDHMLNKNTKAMAQLAPLDHNPSSNMFSLPQNGTGGGGKGVNIPSLELL